MRDTLLPPKRSIVLRQCLSSPAGPPPHRTSHTPTLSGQAQRKVEQNASAMISHTHTLTWSHTRGHTQTHTLTWTYTHGHRHTHTPLHGHIHVDTHTEMVTHTHGHTDTHTNEFTCFMIVETVAACHCTKRACNR